MENITKMFDVGLYINDLSMHDSSRDLVLAGTQQSAELKLALDQVSDVVILRPSAAHPCLTSSCLAAPYRSPSCVAGNTVNVWMYGQFRSLHVHSVV